MNFENHEIIITTVMLILLLNISVLICCQPKPIISITKNDNLKHACNLKDED